MKTIIGFEQIRAARALLGWTQEEFAKASKLSVPTIARLERGDVDPRLNTIQRLKDIFEKAGIEFTDNSGVRRRGEKVSIELWDGADCIDRFMDDYIATLIESKSEGLLSGIDDQVFLHEATDKLSDNLSRMQKLGLHERILLKKGDKFIAGPPTVTTYHWIAQEFWGQVPFIVYGEKVAIIFWNAPKRVLRIENASLAQTYRQQFEALWSQSKPLPYSTKELSDMSAHNLKRRIPKTKNRN